MISVILLLFGCPSCFAVRDIFCFLETVEKLNMGDCFGCFFSPIIQGPQTTLLPLISTVQLLLAYYLQILNLGFSFCAPCGMLSSLISHNEKRLQ